MREWPAWAEYLDRLASFSRLTMFDMRGVGLSDLGSQAPKLQADDLRAVMGGVGSRSAVVFGGARRGSTTALLFAATYPDRARSLVLCAPHCQDSPLP